MNYEEDYRKCSKIAREASRYARLQMKNWELGSGEADCLAQIRKHPGCSQATVQAQLGIDKAAVARMCASLEKKGLIRRQADPQDRRRVQLMATQRGNRLKQDSKDKENEFYAWLFQELDPQEQAVFFALLQRLYQRSKTARQQNFALILAQSQQ